MVIAISGVGIGFRSPEYRLVSHSGTRTVDDKAGEARKSRERRVVTYEETDAGENG
jgi:hypothetical protein